MTGARLPSATLPRSEETSDDRDRPAGSAACSSEHPIDHVQRWKRMGIS
jgi:hypothetical protein